MALDQITRLRQLIGEPIPAGGRATDTMYSDVEMQDFLDRAGNDLNRAAYIGWLAKAGVYANLVTTTEGNASRLNSDLRDHAMGMAKHYEGLLPLAVAGRTRIGKIVRPGSAAI